MQYQAAEALGKMGREATTAVPALAVALKDEDADVRRLTADALGQIRQKAEIAVPLSSSGFPTTAASATEGWLTNALSISIVPKRCPATLMTSSTRPMIQ